MILGFSSYVFERISMFALRVPARNKRAGLRNMGYVLPLTVVISCAPQQVRIEQKPLVYFKIVL